LTTTNELRAYLNSAFHPAAIIETLADPPLQVFLTAHSGKTLAAT